MGLGIIIFGFFFLHFHFLNAQIYNIQLFPLSVSLPIIILGLLYAYRDSTKKEYLYFIFPCILLIVLTFMKDVRFPYLILLTLTYLCFVSFMVKQVSNDNQKKTIKICLLIYLISGFFKAATSMHGLFFNYDINQISSLIYPLSMIVLSYHLYKIKKWIHVESRPQVIPSPLPVWSHFLIIVLCITVILSTHTLFVQHSYDQSIQLDVYEFVSEKVKVKYFIEWGIEPMRPQDSEVTPSIELLGKDRPHEMTILLNENILTKGSFQYDGDEYKYIEEVRNRYESYFEIIPDCVILMDGNRYEAKVQKVKTNEYGYKDSHVQISHCMIENGRAFVMPRVEFFHQKVIVHKMSIHNAKGQILTQTELDEASMYYNDGTSFLPEFPIDKGPEYDNAPYSCTITYTNQDNQTITKEYLLTEYENHMP